MDKNDIIKVKVGNKLNREYDTELLIDKIIEYIKKRFNSNKKSQVYDLVVDIMNIDEDKLKEYLYYIIKNDISTTDVSILALKLCSKMSHYEIGTYLSISPTYISPKIHNIFYKITNIIYNMNQEDIPIGDNIVKSELSSRLCNILKRNNINLNSDLEGMSYNRFIRFRNAGDLTWNELVEYMNRHNIKYSNNVFDEIKIKSQVCIFTNNIISKYGITKEEQEKHQDELDACIYTYINILKKMSNNCEK